MWPSWTLDWMEILTQYREGGAWPRPTQQRRCPAKVHTMGVMAQQAFSLSHLPPLLWGAGLAARTFSRAVFSSPGYRPVLQWWQMANLQMYISPSYCKCLPRGRKYISAKAIHRYNLGYASMSIALKRPFFLLCTIPKIILSTHNGDFLFCPWQFLNVI